MQEIIQQPMRVCGCTFDWYVVECGQEFKASAPASQASHIIPAVLHVGEPPGPGGGPCYKTVPLGLRWGQKDTRPVSRGSDVNKGAMDSLGASSKRGIVEFELWHPGGYY